VDDNITVQEAARRLGRSIEQVRRYLREGKLAGKRVGQQWFIPESALAQVKGNGNRQTEIERWLESLEALRNSMPTLPDCTPWILEDRDEH